MVETRFHWFLPTSGDSRGVVGGEHGAEVLSSSPVREPELAYLRQVAQAAEANRFDSVLTPTGLYCRDPWLTAAALAEHTPSLRFLVAMRPDALSPTLAAQMAATFQAQTGGRLALNVVTGGESAEQRAYGDFLDKEGRYRRTREHLRVVRRLWEHGPAFDHDAEGVRVEQARLVDAPDPVPEVHFAGSSPAALEIAAELADVYLTWGEPPAQAGEKIARVREAAAARGRTLRYGVRLHVITRDTSEQAWAVAQAMLDAIPEELVRRQQQALRASESEGQRRMLALHGGDRRNLEIHPGLWAGSGLIRGGAGTALVGSHEEVADLIRQYEAVGFTDFVLSGHPCLEEAWWFGEGVRPRVDRPEASPRTADARRRERAAAAVD
ncbi:LLM class flavin-dependent oxidoreductase [Rothia kristinae]|uniref:LLM class flavin-dependent oxidoreductase n=1 Tax=Rothia kristinae TaxID=37923 RepID=UPI0009BDF087|nr:LLM class flavin-dependent oxidoreductase [Rothia kristinae]MCT1357606.1 LLM class flavin-dependent oxidoreductase [Rothia kristinae]MCT1393291.1 LLM class flavin-dependent oxidoreductase [Rothia kristinae]MCT1505731.1 LLM class flavin-dependent oxidoreductase [Rothia kristinae]MCT2037843.1 LLM class flavin-dependent oxidoreductase [Rothia kristinae]MCT2243383.1 LLM class flavin-dependent oxidoreductase [Rothia kristinae]